MRQLRERVCKEFARTFFPFIHPSIHPCIPPPIHPFTHPAIRSFFHPFIHLSIHSIRPAIHPSIQPTIHSFIHSFIFSNQFIWVRVEVDLGNTGCETENPVRMGCQSITGHYMHIPTYGKSRGNLAPIHLLDCV